MPAEMTSTDSEANPMLSSQALHRPLVEDELRHLWGDQFCGALDALVIEADRILEAGDEQERAILEQCLRFAILQAMDAHILRQHGGFSDWLGKSLPEAVDRINRYIR